MFEALTAANIPSDKARAVAESINEAQRWTMGALFAGMATVAAIIS